MQVFCGKVTGLLGSFTHLLGVDANKKSQISAFPLKPEIDWI
jgi:hypothetical protein